MKTRLFTFLFVVCLAGYCSAQAFVYHPNNPNFGGNTFNYSWMLSSAQAQDRTTDPTATVRTANGTTQTGSLNSFAQSLQSQLLSRITSSLVGSQFGEGTLKPGTYKFGEYQVDISNGASGVVVRIVDGKGGETSITIPYY
ncbi:curli production assembly/transport component CsgF [Spirosoma linguale]|uniref:Curli production assembly/transport component CsgF n=1 Tax=Spirosoma linguale (strain ATCC 33905 / DSM 74 / LMG 10896 / Claus 1) TaxID=504472 RepID=D2QT92_SPILD|nr:Curli production assembly/transport component CsgF [Spirosoma linguale DSM 74]